MLNLMKTEEKLTLGGRPELAFCFSFRLGQGGAAAASAVEGLSPGFSFCFKTKFSISKTAEKA